MKKLFTLILIFLCTIQVDAKKVKFQVKFVDISVFTDFTGGYIMGDFQKLIGNPDNWLSDSTPMIKNNLDTLLYTIVLDLPAHRPYRYVFLRNQHGYGLEDVPVESEDAMGNRWIYLDSISNDTLVLPAILFGENAPMGKFLMRYRVDMRTSNISINGVHLVSSLNLNNPKAAYMFPIDSMYHEYIEYIDTFMGMSNSVYNFVNGNNISQKETITGSCSIGGTRIASFNNHKILDAVCYGLCDLNCPSTKITTPKVKICVGDSGLLTVNEPLGAPFSTYTWTSTPAGFSSKVKNPFVKPSANTTYKLAINNRNGIFNYNIDVMSVPVPIKPVITIVSKDTLKSSSISNNQWYKNNSIIPNATNMSYQPSSSGNYTVQVTDSLGCKSAFADVVVFNSSSIEAINASQFNIYPIPSTGVIHLTGEMMNGKTTIQVSDIHGKVLLNSTYINSLDLNNYSDGEYFISLIEQGKVKATKGIIVKH